SVTSVLPEPERGAAITRPLAKDMLAHLRHIPVELSAIAGDRAEHHDGRSGQVGEASGGAERGLEHGLMWIGDMGDDGQRLVRTTPGGEKLGGYGREVLDRHEHDDDRR